VVGAPTGVPHSVSSGEQILLRQILLRPQRGAPPSLGMSRPNPGGPSRGTFNPSPKATKGSKPRKAPGQSQLQVTQLAQNGLDAKPDPTARPDGRPERTKAKRAQITAFRSRVRTHPKSGRSGTRVLVGRHVDRKRRRARSPATSSLARL